MASGITPVYQPIIDLSKEQVIGYEALARGPHNSPLESPLALFTAAAALDKISELDWVCRTVALRKALDSGLASPFSLFINFHPEALSTSIDSEEYQLLKLLKNKLYVIAEVTEHPMLLSPAHMLKNLHHLREDGWIIALDDVGVNPQSITMLPFIEPDIIKLDMSLIKNKWGNEQLKIIEAINKYQERTGAIILAEGVETEPDITKAFSMGAQLGQGWYWGKPGPIPTLSQDKPVPISSINSAVYKPLASPFTQMSNQGIISRPASKETINSFVELIKKQAVDHHGALIISDPEAEYQQLLDNKNILQAYLSATPVLNKDNVLFQTPSIKDPLRDEFCLTFVSTHYNAALVVKKVTPNMFEFVFSTQYLVVREIAQSLMARIK